jgi:hypothetical protein
MTNRPTHRIDPSSDDVSSRLGHASVEDTTDTYLNEEGRPATLRVTEQGEVEFIPFLNEHDDPPDRVRLVGGPRSGTVFYFHQGTQYDEATALTLMSAEAWEQTPISDAREVALDDLVLGTPATPPHWLDDDPV